MLFLESHQLLSNMQHGFRRGFSTTTQLVEFTHDIFLNLDLGNQVDAIFIDFSKAFDTVLHSKLLAKLDVILNNPQLVSWISSFLSSRSQFVSYRSTNSTAIDVTSGVPQGSVLGPLLFLIYLNDLPVCISSSIRFYADDCVLYEVIKTHADHYRLQESFAGFCDWCRTWQMNINFKKTVLMSFCSKSPSAFDYSFDNRAVNRVLDYKYLGVIFTHNMTWSKHIDYVCNKALKKLGYLRRTLSKSPKETKLLLFKSLIRPIVDYASVVWNPYKQCEINRLEAIQKKAVRFICHRYDRDFSPSSTLSSLNLTSLSSRRRIESLKFLHSIVTSSVKLSNDKDYINFAPQSTTRSYHNLNLTPYYARTNMFKFSFFPRSIEDWNSLPGTIRSRPSSNFQADIHDMRL